MTSTRRRPRQGDRPAQPPRRLPLCSIYGGRPKLRGPEAAAFDDAVFPEVEGDPRPCPRCKFGLKDEERRTSPDLAANLAAGLYALRRRIVVIHAGFLDRKRGEIFASGAAGAVYSATR